MTTFTNTRTAARALGYTVRRTGYDSEMVAYPVGTSAEHPAAYFTDCPADMLGTVQAMAAHDAAQDAAQDAPAPAVVGTIRADIIADYLAAEIERDESTAAAIDAADWLAGCDVFEPFETMHAESF